VNLDGHSVATDRKKRGQPLTANPASSLWLRGGATRAEYRDIFEVREADCGVIASSAALPSQIGPAVIQQATEGTAGPLIIVFSWDLAVLPSVRL